jgi:pyridoxamine 5'-phosphate oxidase
MTDKEIKAIRREYTKSSLTVKNVNKNPFKQFEKWFDEVLKSGFLEPNAMTVATASKEGKPTARILLLKGFDESGFMFYTNYKSRKGRDLEENPYASLLFFWDKLERQVRIEGKVQKLTKEESEAYFNTRPYKSRVGAWASPQSSVIEDRNVIVKDFLKYMLKFKTHVPLPPVWGGYRLIPDLFEYWQGRPNRLHDRIRYRKIKSEWKIERLAP